MKRFVPLIAVFLIVASAGCVGGGKEEAPSTPAADLVATGKQVFEAKGCTACHSVDGKPGVGPTVKGLYGRATELDNGQTVAADDAYILESIKNPDAKIVKGFNKGIMTSAVAGITDADAKALVEYIRSLK
ncbi:MAG: cytochrome c [Candidatus Hydrothermarchaeota archaeon]